LSSQAGLPQVTAVESPDDIGKRAYAHVQKLVSFGERYPGSEGWEQAIEYISAELKEIGLETNRDTWTDRLEGITFTNISAVLPGDSPHRILVACPHDTKNCTGHDDPEHNFEFLGANDSGSGVGLVLELARELSRTRHRATYEFVFFDGEESIPFHWDITRALFGSRRGRVVKEKNMEAFLNLGNPGTKVVVGDGSEKKLYEDRYPAVVFTGYLGEDTYAQALSTADVFVFPSLTDTFGLVMIEAMACGTPVAAFNVASPIDVVESGMTGEVDADLSIAVDNALKLDRDLVRQGATKFTWERVAEMFESWLVPLDAATADAVPTVQGQRRPA
jgi:hypothetical protein